MPSVQYTASGEFSFVSVAMGINFLIMSAPLLLSADLTSSSVVAVRADLGPIYASLNVPNNAPAGKMYFNNYLFERSIIDTSADPTDPTTWTSTTAQTSTCYMTNLSVIVIDTNLSAIFDYLTQSGIIPVTLPLEIVVVKRALN